MYRYRRKSAACLRVSLTEQIIFLRSRCFLLRFMVKYEVYIMRGVIDMNYFAEGLQGSGKSTLVTRLSELCSGSRVFREGDYCPTELAWCAYTDEQQYCSIRAKYPELAAEIEANTYSEHNRKIICYTKIRTENTAFYKDLEQYEIYNGRLPQEDFRALILQRFADWNGDGMIFECALFQNIVTDLLLYQNASEAEIMAFYREIRDVLADKDFRIIYLKTENVPESLRAMRKERTDEAGNEVWFSALCGFFDESPYAKAHGVSGEAGIIAHLEQRQALELQICKELFPAQHTVFISKQYTDADLTAAL